MTQAGLVSFSLEGDVLTVRDEAGGGAVAVEVDGGGSLTPATDAWFDVPVDDAVSIEAESLRFRHIDSVFLRDDDGEEHGKVTEQPFEIESAGTFVDVAATMKLLVYVERGTITGRLMGGDGEPLGTVVSFDEPTRVVVGARSTHETPAATVTTTDDPADLMVAVSALGSSIKEWSAERSWPTLRGHPPALELGETLHVPEAVEPPSTGVTVAVPPTVADVFRVAPLAHYLGAEIVPGESAALRIGSNHVEPLGSGRALEASVDEHLARCLVLDSLVRIGGYYSIPRREYDELAPTLPFYPPELADEPIDRQLLEYLEVPFSTLRPYVPEWSAAATLRPRAADAEALPALLNALARIRVTDDGRPPESPSDLAAGARLSTAPGVPPGVASIRPTQTRETTWDRPTPGEASLLFVGPPPADEELFTPTTWERFRDDDCPTTTYRRSVTVEELRTALDCGHLYVHYGDRVTSEGFVCSDGTLAFNDLPAGTTGALSVAWPGSTASAAPLFDAALVVALTDAPLPIATARRFGLFLSLANTPASSARLAGIEDRTRFLGDSSRPIASRAGGAPPTVYRIEPADDGQYRVTADLSLADADELGQVIQIDHEQADEAFQLAGTALPLETTLSASALEGLVADDGIPWPVDGAEGAPDCPDPRLVGGRLASD